MGGFLPGFFLRDSMSMLRAVPFPSTEFYRKGTSASTFRALFEHAPIAVARCDRHGTIVEMNPAFERTLDPALRRQGLRLGELLRPPDRERTELLLRDLLNAKRDSFAVPAGGAQRGVGWTAWRHSDGESGEDHVLLIAQPAEEHVSPDESLIQTQRWDTVGRLTGGIVHDFNNLLTGVMLYCDLLLSSLDSRDCRRRYADEIRSAIIHATGLVQQLLVFARPQATPARRLCLNEIAAGMHGLLTRLIGENIALTLNLDPQLGGAKIDTAQAQQILLNLVLNARDALPNGGRITVETRNCRFQSLPRTVAGATSQDSLPAFPCVLLLVTDNGTGMTAETRRRLFEPFFTTKNAGKGTGLGLTTVRSIVTTNQGLIHFESEPGRGTRVMVLFPRASQLADPPLSATGGRDFQSSSESALQEIKKESLL
jgi:PAS domain S-box-containing protein